MPIWFPRSIFGAVVAGIYVIAAVTIVIKERKHRPGGWISLQGILAYLVTFPISRLCEWLGNKLDYRRNLDMALAVLGSALLVYLFCAGLGWVAWLVFSPAGRG
jgi:hypothetical protein